MKQNTSCIGLVNPKSPDNVASVKRAAGNYQIDTIYYTGSRYPRALSYQDRSLALDRKVGEAVEVISVDSIAEQRKEGMKLVCVELAIDATPLPDYTHPESALYVFGPEDGSISQDIIDQADDVVYIPTIGCMNLAATVNVLLYDRLAKQESQASNERVRQSRDRNNRLKVT